MNSELMEEFLVVLRRVCTETQFEEIMKALVFKLVLETEPKED